jgi:hypothetical protein
MPSGIPTFTRWDGRHLAPRHPQLDGRDVGGRGRPAPGSRPGEGEVLAHFASGESIVRYEPAPPMVGTTGEIEPLSLWAGQSVALANRTQPAAEIVAELVSRLCLESVCVEARQKRGRGRRAASDQVLGINDLASARPTTRSWRSPPTSSRPDCSIPPIFNGSKPAARISRSTSSPARSSSVA